VVNEVTPTGYGRQSKAPVPRFCPSQEPPETFSLWKKLYRDLCFEFFRGNPDSHGHALHGADIDDAVIRLWRKHELDLHYLDLDRPSGPQIEAVDPQVL